MHSCFIFVFLVLVSFTTSSLSHTSSFPFNLANWSIDCEEINYVGPSIIFTGALRFHYGPSSEDFIDMPNSHNLVNVSASCEDEVQFVELHWVSKNSSGPQNQWFGLKFSKQGAENDTYGLSAVRYLNFHNMETLFKEIKLNPALTVNMDHSFRCHRYQNITSSDNVNMFLLTENLQFQAFIGNGSGSNFGVAEECEGDDSPLPFDEQNLDTGILIGMSIAVAISGILGAGIGFYLCRKFRQGTE